MMHIIRTTDEERARKITEALKKNGGYCPCSIVKNEDHKCMCKDFLSRTEPGWCHCGLYYMEEPNEASEED